MNEQNRFGELISTLNRAASIYFGRSLAPLGVGPGQQAYLLSLQPGHAVGQEEIATALCVDKANVTRALAALERSGYVVRHTSPADRRARLVSLTERGTAARRSVQTVMERWVGELEHAVTPQEWKVVVRALAKMAPRAMEFAAASEVPPSRESRGKTRGKTRR